MSDLRIMMIGPGTPSEANTGLGIAVHELSKCLSRKAHVIQVQPTDAADVQTSLEKHVGSETFDAERVTKDFVSVAVQSSIATYVYGPEEPDERLQEDPAMKAVWEKFTQDTIKEVEKYDFDVIYAHDWPTFQAGVELKKKSGKPLVLHVHSLDIDRLSTMHRSWIYDVEKEGLAAADKVLTVSKYSAERIEEYYGISPEKIEVIYNGVHAAFGRRSSSEQRGFEPTVLFVGRLSGQKSPFSFLEIARKVLKKLPRTKFVLAGSGDQRNNLIEFAANKKIGDQVYFTGYLSQEELLKVYQRATIFCMPSKSDPFGLAALEAAAAGLPIVLSKECGVAEVLPGAMTANHHELQQFASFIITLLEEPELQKMHATKNETSVSLLTWSKTATEVLDTLTAVAG